MRRWPRGTAQAYVPLYADARFKRMMGSMGGRLKGQLTRLYRSCEKGDKQDSGVPARCFDSPTGWSQGGKTRTCASTGWIKPGNQACTNTSPKRCALRPPAGDTVASSERGGAAGVRPFLAERHCGRALGLQLSILGLK